MPKPTSKQYTRAEKAAFVAEVSRRHAAGEGSYRAIAASLGIKDKSYHNWVRAGIQSTGTTEPAPSMRPVEVMALVPARPAAAKLSLNAPGGYRVEGLDVESAAALLKALS